MAANSPSPRVMQNGSFIDKHITVLECLFPSSKHHNMCITTCRRAPKLFGHHRPHRTEVTDVPWYVNCHTILEAYFAGMSLTKYGLIFQGHGNMCRPSWWVCLCLCALEGRCGGHGACLYSPPSPWGLEYSLLTLFPPRGLGEIVVL